MKFSMYLDRRVFAMCISGMTTQNSASSKTEQTNVEEKNEGSALERSTAKL